MKQTWFPLLVGALLLAGQSARAAVVISEVLFNEVGSDATGEWIEIYNNGAATVDLSAWKIGDEETSGGTGTSEGMFQFPPGAMIAAGEVQIVAVDADTFNANYGFLPAYEVTGANAGVPNLTVYSAWDNDGDKINMSNSNDQAVLLDGADAIADAVSWGGTFAFDPALDASAESDGQSWERINATIDTDTAADWQLGNPSSPGVVSIVPEPAAAALAVLAAAGCLAAGRRS